MGQKNILKIGIALASYKPHHQYFAKQLQSFIDQTFQNWFCVIHCDSSKDEFVNSDPLRHLLKDPRFSVYENTQRLGLVKNFEVALKSVLKQNPDAVAFADQDDVWLPEKLSKQARLLETLPVMSLVHTDMKELRVTVERESVHTKTVWQTEKRNVENPTFSSLLMRNIVTGATLLMDVELAKKYQNIPASMNVHDYWFALAASLNGGVYPLNEPLMLYRQHGGNLVGVNSPLKLNPEMLFHFSDKVRTKYLRVQDMLNVFPDAVQKGATLFTASDKGLGLFKFSIKHIVKDPVLAKDAFGLALGKCLVGVLSKEVK